MRRTVTMTYFDQMKKLLAVADIDSTIYTRKPTKVPGAQCKRLTAKERREVERVSTERGYRRFTAEARSI